jgi:outer membrane lipoprotein SlyB
MMEKTMKNRIRCAVALTAALTTGCAAQRFVPIVDIQASPAAADGRDYTADLTDCQDYAERIDPAASAVAGAIIGAIILTAAGAAVGASFGQAGQGAAFGAAYGGIGGAANGAAAAEGRRAQIVCNCMNGRGWNIL